MILKNYSILTVLALTSGCSLLPTKEVEIMSKPVQIEIMQPTLPRPVELTAPKWYVVSEARIVNPCVKRLQDDGSMKKLVYKRIEKTLNGLKDIHTMISS